MFPVFVKRTERFLNYIRRLQWCAEGDSALAFAPSTHFGVWVMVVFRMIRAEGHRIFEDSLPDGLQGK